MLLQLRLMVTLPRPDALAPPREDVKEGRTKPMIVNWPLREEYPERAGIFTTTITITILIPISKFWIRSTMYRAGS